MVVGLYVLGGFIWIVVSDVVLAALVQHRETLSTLQSLKGFAYVAATGGLLYWRIRGDRRKSEQALNQAEVAAGRADEMKAFATMAPVPLVVFHADATVRFANEAAMRLARQGGEGSVEGILPEDLERLVTETPSEHGPVVEHAGRAGSRFLRWGFYRVESTKAVYALGRDVTDAVELSDRLADYENARLMGQMAAGIAHDFNNVLLVAQGYAELLVPRLAADDPDGETLQIIIDACRRAHDIAARFSRLGAPPGTVGGVVDLAVELKSFAPFLRHAVPRSVAVLFEPPGIPVLASVDRFELNRVLLNLVVNAGDAIGDAPGAVTVRATAAVDDEGTWARVTVEDTGPGISENVMARIWEPFFTTKGPERGTGLGLPVVKTVVERNNGRIVIEPRPGTGARFIVDFPAVPVLADARADQDEGP